MIWPSRWSTTYNMPVCIINGAVGGTRIDQHQANPADHAAPGSLYSIYANLYNRVVGAKLTHGIRGVFWHQGESNSGAAAPTGDWDYKSYQQYFVDMSAAWKQDFPNIQRYHHLSGMAEALRDGRPRATSCARCSGPCRACIRT